MESSPWTEYWPQPRQPVVHRGTDPYLLLDRQFQICGVNAAYLAVTGRAREELLSAQMFEALPGNPHDPRLPFAHPRRAGAEQAARTAIALNQSVVETTHAIVARQLRLDGN